MASVAPYIDKSQFGQPIGYNPQMTGPIRTSSFQPGASDLFCQELSYSTHGRSKSIIPVQLIFLETIIGTFCFCPIGAFGIILAVIGSTNRDMKRLKYAHRLGIISILLGIFVYSILFVWYLIYMNTYAF